MMLYRNTLKTGEVGWNVEVEVWSHVFRDKFILQGGDWPLGNNGRKERGEWAVDQKFSLSCKKGKHSLSPSSSPEDSQVQYLVKKWCRELLSEWAMAECNLYSYKEELNFNSLWRGSKLLLLVCVAMSRVSMVMSVGAYLASEACACTLPLLLLGCGRPGSWCYSQ